MDVGEASATPFALNCRGVMPTKKGPDQFARVKARVGRTKSRVFRAIPVLQIRHPRFESGRGLSKNPVISETLTDLQELHQAQMTRKARVRRGSILGGHQLRNPIPT
jgi:hypothetical protein